MEENELRIGSLFNYGTTVAKAIGIVSDGVLYELTGSNPRTGKIIFAGITGIPLTEEWLIKFGFEKQKTYGSSPSYSNDKMRVTKIDDLFFRELYLTSYGDTDWNVLDEEIELKYVHQFQNYYFALTGKELTQRKD